MVHRRNDERVCSAELNAPVTTNGRGAIGSPMPHPEALLLPKIFHTRDPAPGRTRRRGGPPWLRPLKASPVGRFRAACGPDGRPIVDAETIDRSSPDTRAVQPATYSSPLAPAIHFPPRLVAPRSERAQQCLRP